MPEALKTYTNVQLAAAVEVGRTYSPLLRTLGFGSMKLDESETINFDSRSQDLQIAPLVFPDAVGTVMGRKGYETTSLSPAYTKPKMTAKYTDLQVRPFGMQPTLATSNAAKYAQVVAANAVALEERITRLEDYMAAQLLVTGKVDVTSNSYGNYLLDFQRPAGNDATPSVLWNAANPSPIADLEGHADSLDQPVASIVFGSLAWKLYKQDPDFYKHMDSNFNSTGINLMETSGGQMPATQSWRLVGYHAGLGVPMYLDKTVAEVGGTMKLQVPANKVVFIPSASSGIFGYGAIQDATASYTAMPRFYKNYMTTDPAIPFVQVHSAPVPFHTNIKATGTLTVT